MTDDTLSPIKDINVLMPSVLDGKKACLSTLETEKDYVTALQKGDMVAFEQLFNIYKTRIHLFIKNILVSHSDAEELTQEVFVKIWINRAKIDTNRPISTYVYTVAKNIVYDFLRKKLNQKKYIESAIKNENIETNNIEQNVFYSETLKLIHTLVDQLPDKRKRIFKLSRFEGKSYRQIAEELNISENTVDTQIRHALKHLRLHINSIPKLTIPFFMFFLGL